MFDSLLFLPFPLSSFLRAVCCKDTQIGDKRLQAFKGSANYLRKHDKALSFATSSRGQREVLCSLSISKTLRENKTATVLLKMFLFMILMFLSKEFFYLKRHCLKLVIWTSLAVQKGCCHLKLCVFKKFMLHCSSYPVFVPSNRCSLRLCHVHPWESCCVEEALPYFCTVIYARAAKKYI